eukprot:UN09999
MNSTQIITPFGLSDLLGDSDRHMYDTNNSGLRPVRSISPPDIHSDEIDEEDDDGMYDVCHRAAHGVHVTSSNGVTAGDLCEDSMSDSSDSCANIHIDELEGGPDSDSDDNDLYAQAVNINVLTTQGRDTANQPYKD